MSDSSQFSHDHLLDFDEDTTIRWSCRKDDIVCWLRMHGMFAGNWDMRDFWQCWDGDFLVITNRKSDFPAGFKLHPSELQDTTVWQYQSNPDPALYAAEPIDAPNLWRVRAGDRLLWVGDERDVQPSIEGILGLVEFRENALIARETNLEINYMEWVAGQPRRKEIEPSRLALVRNGVNVVQRLGLPQTLSTGEWGIG
jgi:hypothetical protein